MTEWFFPAIELQQPGHCGPTSLSMCLNILGIDASQAEAAAAIGKQKQKICLEGVDENQIQRAARHLGADCEFLSICDRVAGPEFLERISDHVDRGLPLILLVWDMRHWVAVIARVNEKFVVMDPNDRKRAFSTWKPKTLLKHAWNADPKGDSQYFAIRLRRADGKPARWKVSRSWMRLCEAGSDGGTAEDIANGLLEIVSRSWDGFTPADPELDLADLLEACKQTIVSAAWHWVENHPDVTRAAVSSVYDDYVVIARATGIKVPRGASRTEIVAQLTALMAAYTAYGEL